jgi:hypothetical protein
MPRKKHGSLERISAQHRAGISKQQQITNLFININPVITRAGVVVSGRHAFVGNVIAVIDPDVSVGGLESARFPGVGVKSGTDAGFFDYPDIFIVVLF